MRGQIFQKWVTNFWTDVFDKMFPWNFRSFVHIWARKKNPPQNSPPHLCRIRGVSEAGSPQYHSWVRGWGTPAIDQTACALSCQHWEGAKLGWVVSFVSIGRWQLFRRKHLQETELQLLQQHFLWISSVLLVRVKGICR